MTREVIVKEAGGPTIVSFNITGTYSPADAGTNWLSGTTADTNVAFGWGASPPADAAGWQSAKADLGANRARRYAVYGCLDFTGETPGATGHTAYYWAPSTSSTAANGNVAGNSGGNAAAPDGALGSITIAEFVRQCQYIGQLPTHDGASVQNGFVGVFEPCSRYGQLVIVNNSGDAYEADDVEHCQLFLPLTDEIQDEA